MKPEPELAQRLYRRLLWLYPRSFSERFGETMQQTFDDLYHEQMRRKSRGAAGFVLWMFLDTARGILSEHVRSLREGAVMENASRTLGMSALLGLLLIFPLMIMEVTNRRQFGEDFPLMLFFVLWLNICAISLIVLPIIQSSRRTNNDTADPILPNGEAILVNPRSTAIVSIALLLSLGILPLLDHLGWLSLSRLFNGPNPAVAYLPGRIMSAGLIILPVTAGMIASRPIVNTLRARGSLFAHPLNLLIVVIITILFTMGVAGLIIDQWPCFIGVQNCD